MIILLSVVPPLYLGMFQSKLAHRPSRRDSSEFVGTPDSSSTGTFSQGPPSSLGLHRGPLPRGPTSLPTTYL